MCQPTRVLSAVSVQEEPFTTPTLRSIQIQTGTSLDCGCAMSISVSCVLRKNGDLWLSANPPMLEQMPCAAHASAWRPMEPRRSSYPFSNTVVIEATSSVSSAASA